MDCGVANFLFMGYPLCSTLERLSHYRLPVVKVGASVQSRAQY